MKQNSENELPHSCGKIKQWLKMSYIDANYAADGLQLKI